MASELKSMPAEFSPADESRGITLLDLAEILDQHKIWVESGGDSGIKADLCGVNLAHADLTGVNLQGAVLNKANFRGADLSLANLRGASLVQADLRDTNLLGTELRGAKSDGRHSIWCGGFVGRALGWDESLRRHVARSCGHVRRR